MCGRLDNPQGKPGEQWWAFQAAFREALRPHTRPDEVRATACHMLGRYLGANRVRFVEIDDNAGLSEVGDILPATEGRDRASVSIVGHMSASQFGQPLVIESVERDPRLTRAERAALQVADIGAFVVLFAKRGGPRLPAIEVHSSAPRSWKPEDLGTIAHVADRVWTFVDHTRAQSRYFRILETSAEAIVSVDAQHRITFFNRTAQQVFGYTVDEVLERPLDILIPERLRVAHREHMTMFAMGNQPNRIVPERTNRLYARRKDGEEFPVEIAISKFTFDGEMTLTAALRDITSKAREEIKHRLLSEVGEALAVRIDDNLVLSTITTLAVREFADLSSLYLVGEDGSVQRRGLACRDPARLSLIDAMRGLPTDRRSLHPLWRIFDTRQPLLMQHNPATLTSFAVGAERQEALERINLRSTIGVPILVGDRLIGVLFVTACWPSRAFDDRDVETIQEIARRTALCLESAGLYRLAKSSIQARDEVLAVVAHDLRNPLGTIMLNTSLIRPAMGRPERRSERPGDAIARSVVHMSRMIEDLVDVARIESGHLVLDRVGVDPSGLLLEILEAQRPRAEERSIDVRVDAPPDLPSVWADRRRMVQVLDNLVANAIRATPRGRITLGAGARAGEIVFSVRDTGSGIASADLPHVFDRFWQAERSRSDGAGLGLSIVKSIVEAHGGRTWVESTVGVGTTVFFTMPVARSLKPADEVCEPSTG